ncbi:MAG: hypothetical protein ACI4I4_07405 [Acutalibacteraceae bacterium]
MELNLTLNIPDGDYCNDCQFAALDACENPICTLYGRVNLQSACEHYRTLHGNCKDRLCIDCPIVIDGINGNAKCDKCRVTEVDKRNN